MSTCWPICRECVCVCVCVCVCLNLRLGDVNLPICLELSNHFCLYSHYLYYFLLKFILDDACIIHISDLHLFIGVQHARQHTVSMIYIYIYIHIYITYFLTMYSPYIFSHIPFMQKVHFIHLERHTKEKWSSLIWNKTFTCEFHIFPFWKM